MNSKQSIELLNELLEQDKFGPDGFLYSGVLNGKLKIELEHDFSQVIYEFIDLIKQNASKKDLLELLKNRIIKFDRDSLETEDAENLVSQFEKIMDCIGLESSEGVLSNWMYGFEV